MTRPGPLAAVFVVCAILGWLATRSTFTSLPLLPATAVPALVALALVEAATGRGVQSRIARPGRASRPLAPIAVARLVALAKASSLAASAIGGLIAGYLIYLLNYLDKSIPARNARVAGITLVAALLLLAAALYLERCCRAPKPPGDDDGDSRPARDTWQWHS